MIPSSEPRSPAVSIVILNWNGESLLQACLTALGRQTHTDFETIVVDNGSTDGSVDLVREQFPAVTAIALPRNVGFSRANNLGVRQSRGTYTALLNNDTEPEPNWLAELIHALEAHPEVGFCASKMLLWGHRDLVDACGDFYSVEGVPGKIGHLEPAALYDKPREVFGACAGAAVYRRSMLEELGGFDEDFFIVHEDSDLSFRAQLLGYGCVYVPTAIVYHHLGATMGGGTDAAVYHAQRNTEFVYLKNMPLPLLLKYWPLHVVADLHSFAGHVSRRRGRVFLRAKLDALKMMPGMMGKRRRIQKARRTSAADIDRLLTRGRLWGRLRGGNRGVRSEGNTPDGVRRDR